MKRKVLTPPVLSPAALAELKEWLGITTAQDDAVLSALLRAGLETCEAFTGTMPLFAACEELLPPSGGWQTLATRPVQEIGGIYAVLADTSRSLLPPEAYAIELGADGDGRVRVMSPGEAVSFAVEFAAGLAIDWESLPDGLRHGLVRLAAHQHREREGSGGGGLPPAAVAALWRPWRRLHFA